MTADEAVKRKTNCKKWSFFRILCLLWRLFQSKCLIFYIRHGNNLSWGKKNYVLAFFCFRRGLIGALKKKRNGHSYIRVAFRELKHSDDNIRINYTEFVTFKFFLRKKVVVFIQVDFSKLSARRVNNSKY